MGKDWIAKRSWKLKRIKCFVKKLYLRLLRHPTIKEEIFPIIGAQVPIQNKNKSKAIH